VDQGQLSDIDWEVYPAGLSQVLDKYTVLGLPLLITENGIATQDEALRSTFLHRHLVCLGEALERGAPVIGYLYWSLIDNFEWVEGNRARFGLAAVDYQTQQRSPRPCADLLAQVCQTHCIQAEPPVDGLAR
jgi:beta-glucosidase